MPTVTLGNRWCRIHFTKPTFINSQKHNKEKMTAMVLMRWQNISCYTAQHTTRHGESHGQISTIIATQDAYGASWRGLGQ